MLNGGFTYSILVCLFRHSFGCMLTQLTETATECIVHLELMDAHAM